MGLLRLRYSWLTIALAGAMIFALACGDDEEDATAVPAAQPTTAPAVAAPATAVPVAAPTTPPAMTAVEHVRMAQGAEPNSMYSRDRASLQNVLFQKNMWDPLVEIISDELTGRLATSWESNSDFTQWTWTLRKGVNFHNGDPFNAAALKDSVDFVRVHDPELRGTPNYIDITDVEVLGEHELRWTLKVPHPIQAFEETHFYNGMENMNVLREMGLDTFRVGPIGGGTGAYKFVNWVRLEKVELEANRDWFGPQAATMPELATVFAIPEPGTRLAALLADEIQWLVNPLIPQVEVIEASPDHRIMSREQFDIQLYYLNVGRVPALQDRRLRQAISESIDREAILRDVLGGFGSLLRNNLPTTNILYDPNAAPFPNYDPENAKKLLKELADEGVYTGQEIELLAPRGVYNEDVRQNQVIAAQLQANGINAVAFIADDAIREERTAMGACEWDYQFRLPVDVHGDPQGWYWRFVNPDFTMKTWCGHTQDSEGLWEEPFVNEWLRLGNEARVLPVGAERNAKWLEAMDALNQSYSALGLYQLHFVYGVSNEWDWEPEKREAAYIWAFQKR